MAHQYLNNGEEEEAPIRPANEPERRDDQHEDVPTEEASNRADEPVATNAAPRRQRRNKNGDARETQAEAEEQVSASSAEDDDIRALEELGFTRDEATRLIDVADRLTHSDEARVAEATRKRLQFAKWLVEQGLLDEFSLHD